MRADFLNTDPGEAATPSNVAVAIEPQGPERYFNRELSWLAFNWRVLEEARNPRTPLLERVRFLSISGSNLDEFYNVRVAGLRAQMREGVERRSLDGRTASQQLALIDQQATALQDAQQETWSELRPMLASEGIHLVGGEEATLNRLRQMQYPYGGQILLAIQLPQTTTRRLYRALGSKHCASVHAIPRDLAQEDFGGQTPQLNVVSQD